MRSTGSARVQIYPVITREICTRGRLREDDTSRPPRVIKEKVALYVGPANRREYRRHDRACNTLTLSLAVVP